MRIFFLVIGLLVAVVLVAGDALAFTCPKLQKEANEAITKAESAAAKVTGDREKGRAIAIIALAKDLVKQSEADHKDGADKKDTQLHYRSEAKAKAAKALANMVK